MGDVAFFLLLFLPSSFLFFCNSDLPIGTTSSVTMMRGAIRALFGIGAIHNTLVIFFFPFLYLFQTYALLSFHFPYWARLRFLFVVACLENIEHYFAYERLAPPVIFGVASTVIFFPLALLPLACGGALLLFR